MIADQQLKLFSQQGFWIGPKESEFDFLKRISLTKSEASDCLEGLQAKEALQKANYITQAQFDFTCDHIPCSYENKFLNFWEGAALWIEEKDQIAYPRIQLKKSFLKGSYLFYRVEEVLSHEMLHAARVAYDEPKYEEILAYKTSKSVVRKTLGPLFQTPKDSYLFILLLMVGLLLEMVSAFAVSFPYIPWMALPFVWIGFLGLKLSARLKTFNKAKQTLRECLTDPRKALAMMARLTDKEIDLFSKSSRQEILDYFTQKKAQDIRERSLFLSYFS